MVKRSRGAGRSARSVEAPIRSRRLGLCGLALAVLGASAEAAEAPAWQATVTDDGVLLGRFGGQPLLQLVPELAVAYSQVQRPPPTNDSVAQAQPIPFGPPVIQLDGDAWQWTAEAHTPQADYRLFVRHQPPLPSVEFELAVAYKQSVLVHQELLRFRTRSAGPAWALDRAYRMRPVIRPAFSGPLTPHFARFFDGDDEIAFLGGRGVQGLWIRETAERRSEVEVEIDHQHNHPFRAFAGCLGRPGGRLLRLRLDETRRERGESARVRFAWLVGPVQPVLVGRYPAGALGAIVFTDHADQSEAQRLEAFAFGRSGALAAGEIGPRHPGFVNRGLTYSKTIFLQQVGRYAPQFDDPQYRKLLDEMARRGVEIGVHSVSGYRDRPAWSVARLNEFHLAYGGRTWIDHQPDTNCEALANLGWNPWTQWYMLGILSAFGIRFAAHVDDMPMQDDSLNLLVPDQPGMRRALIYPCGRLQALGGQHFVLFSSSWMFVARERFVGWFGEAALDRLIEEQGLLIGHVYFDTWRRRGRMQRNSLLEPDGSELRLRPEVDALFRRLAARVDRGQLVVAGVERIAEHLLGAMDTEVQLAPGGRLRLVGPSDHPLAGLTLLIPDADARVRPLEGRISGSAQGDEQVRVWLDLPAGATRSLVVEDERGRPLPLVLPSKVELVRREPREEG